MRRAVLGDGLVPLQHDFLAGGRRTGRLLVEDPLRRGGRVRDAGDERLGDVLVGDVLRLQDVLVALLRVRFRELVRLLLERRLLLLLLYNLFV